MAPTNRSPYRPFTSFLPYDLKTTPISGGNGNGFFDPLNQEIDLQWGGARQDEAFNNYYDYFFSGEDVKIFIDGLFDPADEMDIASMAYVVKQEKQPLYGFWSYNYDAMMNGTRLITGEFSIYSRYPRRMTSLLEKAAKVRSESSGTNPPSSVISSLNSLNESQADEVNINKYWTSTQLDRVTSDRSGQMSIADHEDGGHNIFSAHPPFNLVIFYGVEETGITSNSILTYKSGTEINQQLNSDRILATDINERSSISASNSPMKIVLQNVQLVSMSTAYQSGGQPLVENYQFIARDFYFSNAGIGDKPFMDKSATVPSSTETTSTTGTTTSTTVTGVQVSGTGTQP
jgi:uncharacterized protein YlxW (UPF0749 family)